MMRDVRRLSVSVVPLPAMVVFAVSIATHALAQGFRWPEEPENIEALSPTVVGAELGAVMRGFTNALGVRCEHCHAGREGRELDPMDLTTFDFTSDAKPTKAKARAMITMTRAINEEHLAPLEASVSIDCVTCHRGQTKPEMLEDVLADVIDDSGAEAAVARYEELRSSHYGGFSYDFSAGVLGTLGERLLGEERTAEAVRILELELEHNPEFAYGRYLLASAYEKAGERARAIEQMEQAVALATPEQGKSFFERALQRLREN